MPYSLSPVGVPSVSSIVNSLVGGVSGNSGAAGMNYQADKAPIVQASTVGQANDAYGLAQGGIRSYQDLLSNLQAQNGLQNQSTVFNQLQGVANGTGPNPAQAMLNQSTGANVANQAALMAGQRGSNANVGLLARQAAQQGAGIQQNAAGQAATMQANQSLNALNNMGGLATNQANQLTNATQGYNNTVQGEQANILGGIAAQNQATVGSQGSVNSANSNIASGVAKGQSDLLGGILGGAASGAKAMAGGGMVPDNVPQYADGGTTNVGSTPLQTPQSSGPKSKVGQFLSGMTNSPQVSKPQDSELSKAGQSIGQGINSGIKSIGSSMGDTFSPSASSPQSPTTFAQSSGREPFADGGDAEPNIMDTAMKLAPLLLAAYGGRVPALLSPGEAKLSPDKVKKYANGTAGSPLKDAEIVPGKSKYPGNDYRNDVVRDDPKAGSIIIPNEIMQSKNKDKESAKFVAAVAKKQALKKGK